MSDHNEEIEENEPTRCRKCGRHYNLRVGEDPTPYCDWCAHKIVDELTAKLADAERERDEARKMWEHWQTDATVKGGELSRTSTAEQVWRNAFDEAIRQRDAAIARAEALQKDCARISEECGLPPSMAPAAGEIARIIARAEAAEHALQKINVIRNSIVAHQSCNFSEHVYPLVAALNEAGIEGMPYPDALAYFGPTTERAAKAEAERDELRREVESLKHCLVRHNCGKPECLCVKCCREEDARA